MTLEEAYKLTGYAVKEKIVYKNKRNKGFVGLTSGLSIEVDLKEEGWKPWHSQYFCPCKCREEG